MNIYKLKIKQKIYYKSIGVVFCPILGQDIYFTSTGFNHLLYDSNLMPRNINEQYSKLSCLKYAPDVIKNCQSVSEMRVARRKIKGKWKKVTRYELAHTVRSGITIRVVIEKIGTGTHKFLSIMPHDKKTRKNLPRKSNKKRP